MEKPCPDAAAFLSEDDQTGFDLGEDGLGAATRWYVEIAAHSSSYIRVSYATGDRKNGIERAVNENDKQKW